MCPAGGGDSKDKDYLAAEARARVEIDKMLVASGWEVQDQRDMNLGAARGVAVREVTLKRGHGRADYLLFVDRRAVGAIEAKPAGTPLVGVEWQSAKYTTGLPDHVAALTKPLPFAYESTGHAETRFTNAFDPEPASRRVFSFHRPETLARWCERWRQSPDGPETATLRQRILQLPRLGPDGLWPAQLEAIRNLEDSLQAFRPRALIQMATGSGKTFTAANTAYRLIKFADARRILFLVDRANLGRQALREFQSFVTPDDGRKFTDLYNVQHLTSNTLDDVSRVTITTIQRLYSMLRGDASLDEETDERSAFDVEPAAPVEIGYNPAIPIETFDVIIVDECHRSIYGVWRQVLDYFDAFVVGLTATPGKQTFGFFNGNMVMEYGHERAVADNVNVDFDVYRIRTEITEKGAQVDAGLVTKFRDRETRAERLEKLDRDYEYDEKALDRSVVAKDQIRTIVKTFKERLPEIFPGRDWVPKTLIFAKSDSHADDIVQIVREEFGKGNDFAVKITYRSGSQGQSPETLLQSFRNSPMPRIAVTVDMIATGTDVKPLECVFFMRTVKSRNFFEQMKGRGVRVIDPTDLRAVTPDALAKDRFVIIDAVGATETELSDTQPLERQPSVSLEQLFRQVTFGARDEDTVSTLAARIARLNTQLTASDRAAVEATAGKPISELTRALVDALDPDLPDREGAVEAALRPFTDNPVLRQQLVDIRRSYDQLIDETSSDTVIEAGYSADAADRARATVESFRQFIEDNKDEITALQILYNRPYPARLTFAEIKDLADAIGRPPRRWTPESLWQAYEALDKSKVRGAPAKMLTNLVSLVRFAIDQDDELVPFADTVDEKFAAWLRAQEQSGRTFTPEQLVWLERIRDTIAGSLAISTDDFVYTPFTEHGGIGKAVELFGADLGPLLEELNEELVA
ncbi:MAG: type I restriction-modification enzyme R subunit C-terminal domain-containing protein [Acidimicrobiia bacterium]